MPRRRSAPAALDLVALPPAVQPWHDQALAGALTGLPDGMRAAPRAQQPFRKKPDGLERMAALWRPAGIAAHLHQAWTEATVLNDALGNGAGTLALDQRLHRALYMVVRQIPERVRVWNDRIGQRLETEVHTFSPVELEARDLCLGLLLAYRPTIQGLVLGTAVERTPGWFPRLVAQPRLTFDMNGDSVLHHVASDGHAWALAALVDAGANVNARARASGGDQDVEGETPLGSAARRGQHAACEALLGLGADPRLINARGLPPSGVARERQHTACVDLLIAHEQAWWRREMDVLTGEAASTPAADRDARRPRARL